MQGQLSPLSTWADEYISFDAIYPEMVDENGVAVWRASWSRRREFLRDCADAIHPAYFRGLRALDLRPDRFPTLPELNDVLAGVGWRAAWVPGFIPAREFAQLIRDRTPSHARSEEHTSELQSHHDLVCRLLLEKKKT